MKTIGQKKILIVIAFLIIVLTLLLNVGNKKDNTLDEDMVYRNTISISRTYIALRLKTDKVLTQAKTYSDYNSWNNEMNELLYNWKNLETKASLLDKQSNFEDAEKVSFNFVNIAHAYTKDEISNVFDKARAGSKIRTLAKYLGVDAKRAFKILKLDQDFVKADAWNEAGDTFKKLEVSATVIKDGCKVAGFVGAMAITGGAASVGGVGAGLAAGTVTAGEAVILVVTGTDLVLEVSEDAVTIALGDQHKAVKAISNIRSVTDPAASLLSLKDIPKNVSKLATKLDKIGVVLVQVDQVRSMVQDGKFLGINITPDSKKIEVAPLKDEEVTKWLDEYNEENDKMEDNDFEDLDDWLESFEGLDDWLEDIEDEDEMDSDEDSEEEEVVEETEAENNEGEDDEQSIEDDVRVMEDSTVDDYATKVMKMKNEGLLTDEEWDKELEIIKEMVRQKEAGERIVEDEFEPDEEASTGEVKNDIVGKYMEEMQGKEMDDYAIAMEYAKKFDELVNEGLISETERYKLIDEVNRLSEELLQKNKSVEEREATLIEASTNKYIQINKESPSLEEIFKMTEAERLAVEESQISKQEARKAKLKADCISLHGEGENAEMCYFRGKF